MKTNIRYFSSLTATQKDKSTNYIRMIIAGLNGLEWNFAMTILRSIDVPDVRLEGCQMYKPNNFDVWIPINIKSIMNDYKQLN